MTKYSDTGSTISNSLDSGNDAVGLALAPSNNDLYVVHSGSGGYVKHLALNCGERCTPLDEFGNGYLHTPQGIGLSKTGTAYIANSGNGTVSVFKELALPTVATGSVTEPEPTSGTLNGEVNPAGNGEVEECKFEYGPTEAYGSSVPCEQATPYATVTKVTAKLMGLTAETPYHYRLAARNAEGASFGKDATYTPHNVLGVTTEAATGVGPASATLTGSFIGNKEDTKYYFEWGLTNTYEHKTSLEDAGVTEGITKVLTPLTDIMPQTTYHYRLVAENGFGATADGDDTLTTLPSVTGLTTEAATVIRPSTVTLNASYVGNKEDTKYYFEWGLTNTYGEKTAVQDAGSTEGPTMVATSVTGLTGLTTYHYRVVAETPLGPTKGGDRTVTTLLTRLLSATRRCRTCTRIRRSSMGRSTPTRDRQPIGLNTEPKTAQARHAAGCPRRK